MKQRILCVAWAAIGLSMSAAAADPVRMAQAIPGLLPAHEIAAIVRSAGFVPISPAMRRGDSYVLRATGRDGRELRVVVSGRGGEIVSAVPVIDDVRGEPIRPQGYIYEAAPPIMYEGDRPLRRLLAPVPNASPRGARAAVPDAENNSPLAEPSVIMREERGEHGLLPPPPERFPQRSAPAAAAPKPAVKPAPVKRAAATPLPKPKPAAEADKPAAAAGSAPAPAAAEGKVDARALPH